jgi:hypothetical protein
VDRAGLPKKHQQVATWYQVFNIRVFECKKQKKICDSLMPNKQTAGGGGSGGGKKNFS